VTNHKTQASIFHNPKGICLFATLPKKKDAWGRQAEDKHEYEEKTLTEGSIKLGSFSVCKATKENTAHR